MFEICLTLGGVILGALLTAGYERMMERREAKHIRLCFQENLRQQISELNLKAAKFKKSALISG